MPTTDVPQDLQSTVKANQKNEPQPAEKRAEVSVIGLYGGRLDRSGVLAITPPAILLFVTTREVDHELP